MKKKVTPHHKSKRSPKRKMKGGANNGALFIMAILGVTVLFGMMLSGGTTPVLKKLKNPTPPGSPYLCCDSGDGAACHPLLDKQITYKGEAYGLLKSNILQPELGRFPDHVEPSGEFTPDRHMIFLNMTFEIGIAEHHRQKGDGRLDPPASRCSLPNMDFIWMTPEYKAAVGTDCFGVPNDEIIYVCKLSEAECSKRTNMDKLPFDVYFRLKDGAVPDAISTYCPKPKVDTNTGKQQIINLPTPKGEKNLQLETFLVKEEQSANDWLGAWCKPAINLYPTEKTDVHVEVAPKGKFTLTIPQYPEKGWDVTAYPDGTVVSNHLTYPYLYWEASIPDSLIGQPQTGYVVAYKDLGNLFASKLPQMGLSPREVNQFSEYWLKALPVSPYYFVGVMPESKINDLAPLSISPTPDSMLRVSLYFKALDKPMSVAAPALSGFERHGFTVTEWGGFFKADKNHPGFTCMM